MFLPNHFVPSAAVKRVEFDSEGRLRETRYGHGDTGGVGDANSLYATDAERFDQMAPFLRRNMAKDHKRRNYIIRPGGEQVIFEGGGEVQRQRDMIDFPTSQESFGHNTMEGTKMAGEHGRMFTVGTRQGGPQGRGGM